MIKCPIKLFDWIIKNSLPQTVIFVVAKLCCMDKEKFTCSLFEIKH